VREAGSGGGEAPAAEGGAGETVVSAALLGLAQEGRRNLCSDQVGACTAPHTPRAVWAGPLMPTWSGLFFFFSFFLFVSLFSFSLFPFFVFSSVFFCFSFTIFF
jgi:hypothetical protein